MDRRAFLKLAAASPVLVSNPEGYASGTVIGSQPLDPPTDFTFYSPLAEAWYRAGEYFEWTSTTRNNEGRRVKVFYQTFGSRSNPALVILHGYPTSSFDFREMIPFLEEDHFESPDIKVGRSQRTGTTCAVSPAHLSSSNNHRLNTLRRLWQPLSRPPSQSGACVGGRRQRQGNTALGDPRRTRESSGYGPNRITPGRSDLDFDPL